MSYIDNTNPKAAWVRLKRLLMLLPVLISVGCSRTSTSSHSLDGTYVMQQGSPRFSLELTGSDYVKKGSNGAEMERGTFTQSDSVLTFTISSVFNSPQMSGLAGTKENYTVQDGGATLIDAFGDKYTKQ